MQQRHKLKDQMKTRVTKEQEIQRAKEAIKGRITKAITAIGQSESYSNDDDIKELNSINRAAKILE